MGVVERHRGGAGIHQKLHRLAVDRTGHPVMSANALGDAQALPYRLGKTGTVFTTQWIGALDSLDTQHRALLVDADYLYPARTALADPHQLALAIDIEHRRTGKQANHLDLRGRPGRTRT